MPFELPPYTRLRGGKLYLNLPVPADLRLKLTTGNGKPKTHIVEALGTGDPTEGRRLARLRVGDWARRFEALRKDHRGELPSDLRRALHYRHAVAESEKGDDAAAEAVLALVREHAERIEAEAGKDAAEGFFKLATRPDQMTLLQAIERMGESGDLTEGTKRKRRQQLEDLLRFLGVPDCLPEFVTEARAVAYVDDLNKSKLQKSTKQDRLSGLQTIWRFLERKRQVQRAASPWTNHEVTNPRPAEGERPAGNKRGWKESEAVALLQAPDDDRPKHYIRSLFRELYVVGFVTGMRLDEIVSIRPSSVEAIDGGGFWINVEQSKTEAGLRGVPVVHKAAVAILKRRLEAQRDPGASIFPECRPGGPDNKLSWQVQKAMGRDRAALGFGSEVDFHSTRRSFLTMMENSGADVVHVQRYVGHRVPTMMHAVYSDGASRASLIAVAKAVRYGAKVEGALLAAVAAR